MNVLPLPMNDETIPAALVKSNWREYAVELFGPDRGFQRQSAAKRILSTIDIPTGGRRILIEEPKDDARGTRRRFLVATMRPIEEGGAS